MDQVRLSAGIVEVDISGDGPPVVLLHGLLMNHMQWDTALPHLPTGYRYLRPILPLGSHRLPMRPGADLSLYAVTRLVAELLEVLDLREVTLVHTDWGGGLFLTALGLDERVGRMVILPCEAFENFPPGLPGKTAAMVTRLPGGISLAVRQLRMPRLRRSRPLLGQMAKYPLDQSLVVAWTDPCLRSREVRRDLRAYTRSALDPHVLIERTEALAGFEGDTLILWSPENQVMPHDHARRLASLMPHARLKYVNDAFVLSMIDQPERVGAVISDFLSTSVPSRRRPHTQPKGSGTGIQARR